MKTPPTQPQYRARVDELVEVIESPYSMISNGWVGKVERAFENGVGVVFHGVTHPMKAGSSHCAEFNSTTAVTLYLKHGQYKQYIPSTDANAQRPPGLPDGSESARPDTTTVGA